MTGIVVTLDASLFTKKLGKLVTALDPSNLLRVIGARLEGFVDESFRTQGRGRWKRLSALTILMGGNSPLQRSGEYKRSFVTTTDGRTFVEIGSRHKLAIYHEFGTKPYVIRVVNAQVLAAKKPSAGWIIFGKEVNHPGIPARPVLPTKAEAEKILVPVVEAVLKQAVE